MTSLYALNEGALIEIFPQLFSLIKINFAIY